MGLPRANINWLFDDTRSAVDQLRDVGDWLERRQQQLKAAGSPAADLILYYVGHGMFCGPQRAYHVAIRATEESREGLTSISVSQLAQTLNDRARFLRKFLVLDCCFAGAAYHEFLSGPLEASRAQLINELPSRGTALLCAASAKEAAIAPQGLPRTMFSDSLLKSLEAGHPGLGTRMSLIDLGALVRQHIKESFPDNWVRPEIHCPDQKEGDVATVELFPNPSAMQQADLERRARQKADEDQKKAAKEAKEREELERIHKAAQEREAAAQRKAEEAREAELARLRLAAREAEQKRRAAEEAPRKAQEQARAAELARQEEKAKREAQARLDAQRREAETQRRRAEDAARQAQEREAAERQRRADEEAARRNAEEYAHAQQTKKRPLRDELGENRWGPRHWTVAVLAVVVAVVGVKLFPTGSHQQPPESPVSSSRPAAPVQGASVAVDTDARPSTTTETTAARPETSPECAGCPEMVHVPGGSFDMGSPADEQGRYPDEGPVHPVDIAAFEASKYPITRGQWRQYLADTHRTGSNNCYGFNQAKGSFEREQQYNWQNPGFDQGEDHPVVCVTWRGAVDYAAWLRQKTGRQYRLLTEAEYEYIERANNKEAYPWGNTSDGQCEKVNAADATLKAGHGSSSWSYATCTDGFEFTSPVNHFPANAFGLYDTGGNVLSWTQDCYHDSYKDAPQNGSAWDGGPNCSRGRVVRGGSWNYFPWGLRSASRSWGGYGGSYVGFRVARTAD